MAFVNFNERQDMQDDTFKIVAILISMAIQSLNDKDVREFHSIVEAIHIIAGGRLPDDDEINKEIEAISNILYSLVNKDARQLSVALDRTKKVFKRLTRGLDKAGLLFRMEAKQDEIYKRGSKTT